MAKKTYKPGEKAPRSGQYGIIEPRVKKEPLPQPPKKGQRYILNDPTKH